MTAALFVGIALAGGLGCASRLLLDGLIRARLGQRTLPWGTILINIAGSLALGLLAGLAGHVLPEEAKLVAGTGFLGGFTTFSTASFETVRLLQTRRWGTAAANGIGVLLAASLAAWLGMWIGSSA